MKKLLPEAIDKVSLQEELKFELDFFSYIAKTDDFEIITIPIDVDGRLITPEEAWQIALDCKKRGIKLIFRISQGDKALVFTEDFDVTGIVPEYDSRGFYC